MAYKKNSCITLIITLITILQRYGTLYNEKR